MDKIITTELVANQKKKMTDDNGGLMFDHSFKKFKDDQERRQA